MIGDSDDMEVQVIQATTGETVHTSVYSEVNDLQVWELRVHICHALDSVEYFSIMLFQGSALLDDAAFVSDYREAAPENQLQIYLIVRELRPPTDEETRAIINGIDMRHRTFLWTILSRGVQMTSTIPAGTARESTIVRAITSRPFPENDVGPLPDIVTMLLLAMCDPDEQGHRHDPLSELQLGRMRRPWWNCCWHIKQTRTYEKQDRNCLSSLLHPEVRGVAFRSYWRVVRILAQQSTCRRRYTRDKCSAQHDAERPWKWHHSSPRS